MIISTSKYHKKIKNNIRKFVFSLLPVIMMTVIKTAKIPANNPTLNVVIGFSWNKIKFNDPKICYYYVSRKCVIVGA